MKILRKCCTVVVLVLALVMPIVGHAATQSLIFMWSYDFLKQGKDNTWFEGWAFYYRLRSHLERTYWQVGEIIPWDGVIRQEYEATIQFDMPAGSPKTYLFILLAKIKETPENLEKYHGLWSPASREVVIKWDGAKWTVGKESPDTLRVKALP